MKIYSRVQLAEVALPLSGMKVVKSLGSLSTVVGQVSMSHSLFVKTSVSVYIVTKHFLELQRYFPVCTQNRDFIRLDIAGGCPNQMPVI